MVIRFTWSKRKAALNLKHHRISFEESRNVFSDPYAVVHEDCESDEGMRYHAIGYVNEQLLAAVVFLDQTEGEDIHFHIISARKAEAFEKSLYAEQFP